MGGPKVHEVMTDNPRCVTPETPVSEAARLMKIEDVGSLPILEGEKVTGVVTDRDIVVRAVAEEKDPRGMPVREVASRELVTIRPDEDLSEALKLMASYQVRRLPVVDEDNRLVGVLSQADVATEAKEKDFAQMVEGISQTPTGPRV
jgi:CBS domain-containing protein